MWETSKTFNGNGSFRHSLSLYERPCPTQKQKRNMKRGQLLAELLMGIGFLLLLGSVGAYSNGSSGKMFVTGLAVSIVTILIGYAVRKYIIGRWR